MIKSFFLFTTKSNHSNCDIHYSEHQRKKKKKTFIRSPLLQIEVRNPHHLAPHNRNIRMHPQPT